MAGHIQIVQTNDMARPFKVVQVEIYSGKQGAWSTLVSFIKNNCDHFGY